MYILSLSAVPKIYTKKKRKEKRTKFLLQAAFDTPCITLMPKNAIVEWDNYRNACTGVDFAFFTMVNTAKEKKKII